MAHMRLASCSKHANEDAAEHTLQHGDTQSTAISAIGSRARALTRSK